MAFTNFRDWFFEQFPEYYQTNDVNLDATKEGTFKRYLRVYGLELDDEIMPYIDSFMDIVDIIKCDSKFLPLIGRILGDPPGFGPDPTEYRKILAFILSIYKVKGTKLAYQIFFGILGFKTYFIIEVPAKKITYDMKDIIYDKSPTLFIYDSQCAYCSGYYLGVSTTNNFMPDEGDQDKLNKIICFLQPINAKFLGFTKSLYIKDTYIETLEDEFTPATGESFDTDEFDNSEFN